MRLDAKVPRLSAANVRALEAYDWPGNVRELRNVVERAIITSASGRLQFDALLPVSAPELSSVRGGGLRAPLMTESEIDALRRENTVRALEEAGGKVYGEDGAAALLGIKPTTLASRIKKMGLDGEE